MSGYIGRNRRPAPKPSPDKDWRALSDAHRPQQRLPLTQVGRLAGTPDDDDAPPTMAISLDRDDDGKPVAARINLNSATGDVDLLRKWSRWLSAAADRIESGET